MKKLLAGFLSVCLLLSAAGCHAAPDDEAASTPTPAKQQEVQSSTPTEPTQDAAPSTPSMHAVVMPSVREEISSEDGTLLFSLSFPKFQMILGNEGLEETITGSLQDRMNGVLSEAEDIHNCAEQDYADADPEYWSPYSFGITYTPTRLDTSIMSLFGNRSRYSGGAHPISVTDSVTYDLETGKILLLEDILSADTSLDSLCTLVLNALEEKAQTLSYGYEEMVRQRFAGDEADIPQWYFSRSGLCFHFPPYDIAPYSSGAIIAEIPYEELRGVLREQYFPIAVESANGSVYAQVYEGIDPKRFTFMADVALSESGSPIVLYSDATVTDMRIETGTLLDDGSSFISTGVVFMADAVHIGDGITLHADLTDPETVLQLVYRSGEHEVSSLITWDAASGNVVLTGK